MDNITHYFENLLYYGEDEVNKKYLTQEEKNAIETCVAYVKYTMFTEEELKEFLCQ